MTGQRDLPIGTVTFLFTDIEGSTRLAADLGPAAYAPLLERHRALLRDAIDGGGGIEVQTMGDGIFAVFAKPSMAVAAAAAAQRALATEPWPAEAAIRVRMGLHTGDGWLDADGSYFGNDVNRAARVAAAGHGGQVVVSETTASLVVEGLPGGVTVRDLGRHRLKDLQPQRLFQLDVEGLASDFPAIRSLDARPNNLPVELTSFVGREAELTEVLALLGRSRLLTLTGPGGIGKSRLSLQLAAAVADEFPDGVFFVPLEPVREASLVAPTIAAAIGLVDAGGRSPDAALAEHLASRVLLLVLDNFEQVVAAAPLVSSLLQAAPRLRIVVSSRAPLHVSGEQEYPVPGLPVPPDVGRLAPAQRGAVGAGAASQTSLEPEDIERFEAVRLFLARATAVKPDFALTRDNAEAVAAICTRLHGLPLAIELAAARIRLLAPQAIRDRLDQQLTLLASGARDLPDRQRSLRGAIAWSYDLLDEPSRRLLDRLSVFVGTFGLEAAEAVAGPADDLGVEVLDGLGALADQSLIKSVGETDGGPRFFILDTIREFAGERLQGSGEAGKIHDRHLATFLALAERAAAELVGPDQRMWADRLELDHDNLRAALAHAVARPDPEAAARMPYALWRFWQQRGHLNEAADRLAELAIQPWDLAPLYQARLAEAAGGVAYWRADPEVAVRAYDDALALWRTMGDDRELGNALYNRAYLATVPMMEGQGVDRAEVDRARAMLREARELAHRAGDAAGEGNILWALATVELFSDNAPTAEAAYREALALHRQAGNQTMEAWSLHMLGLTLLRSYRRDEAAEACRHALRHFDEAGDVGGITLVIDDMAALALAADDFDRAGRLWGAARALEAATGAELATYVETGYTSIDIPSPRQRIPPADLERLAAEGARLSLEEAVAYAFGGDLPLSVPPE